MQQSNILYAAVTRVSDKYVVANYIAGDSANVHENLYQDPILKVIDRGTHEENERQTIVDSNLGSIHYDCDPALMFSVVTSSCYPQRTAFKLLTEIRISLESEFQADLAQAKNAGLRKAARAMLKDIVSKYQNASEADKINSVAVQVEEVKGAMQMNIQAALRNQQNLETLLNTSDAMRNEASSFNKSTAQAKERMHWKNMKMRVIIVVLVLAFILIVSVPIIIKKTKAA